MKRYLLSLILLPLQICLYFSLISPPAHGWSDETHIAAANASGYSKWFNACGPDMITVKMGDEEDHNHYVNNSRGTVITPELVMAQVEKFNKREEHGHLYGAIIASLRDYVSEKKKGKYAEYYMAFCGHYVTDLSQPLHNTEHNPLNKRYHEVVDRTVNDEILWKMDMIKIYPITISSEGDLAKEIGRIANLSMALGYKLQDENRILSKEEAYIQLGHSASLFKAVLEYTKNIAP